MSYFEQWRALAARIRGLVEAGGLYAQFQASSTDDSFGISQNLNEHCRSVVSALETFRASFHAVLPPTAQQCLAEFLDGHCAKMVRND
jgi:hypothetical protein